MPSSRTKPGVFILASGAQQSVLWGRGRGACNLPVTQPQTPGSDHAVALSEPAPRCASPRRAGHPGPISAPTEAREGGHRPWREAAGRGRGRDAGASGTSGRPAARTARATGARAGGCGAVAHAQSPPGHGLRQTLVPPSALPRRRALASHRPLRQREETTPKTNQNRRGGVCRPPRTAGRSAHF